MMSKKEQIIWLLQGQDLEFSTMEEVNTFKAYLLKRLPLHVVNHLIIDYTDKRRTRIKKIYAVSIERF